MQVLSIYLTFTRNHTPMEALESNVGLGSCERIFGKQTVGMEPLTFRLADDLS